MGRTFGVVFRFLIGVIAIVVVMRFLGVTWADVDYFIEHGLKEAFKVLESFQSAFQQ